MPSISLRRKKHSSPNLDNDSTGGTSNSVPHTPNLDTPEITQSLSEDPRLPSQTTSGPRHYESSPKLESLSSRFSFFGNSSPNPNSGGGSGGSLAVESGSNTKDKSVRKTSSALSLYDDKKKQNNADAPGTSTSTATNSTIAGRRRRKSSKNESIKSGTTSNSSGNSSSGVGSMATLFAKFRHDYGLSNNTNNEQHGKKSSTKSENSKATDTNSGGVSASDDTKTNSELLKNDSSNRDSSKSSSSFELLDKTTVERDLEAESSSSAAHNKTQSSSKSASKGSKSIKGAKSPVPTIELSSAKTPPSPSRVTFEVSREEERSSTESDANNKKNSQDLDRLVNNALLEAKSKTSSPSKHGQQPSSSSSISFDSKERRLTSSSESALSTSTFKVPLAKLKKKTVSMLFSDNSPTFDLNASGNIEKRRNSESAPRNSDSSKSGTSSSPKPSSEIPSRAESVYSRSGSPKRESPMAAATSCAAMAPPVEALGVAGATLTRPFPMLRSKSSQSQAGVVIGATGIPEMTPTVSNNISSASTQNGQSLSSAQQATTAGQTRPRSRTLNSLTEKSTTSNSQDSSSPSFVSRSSFSSLLAGKLRSDDNHHHNYSSSRKHSPSPRPSVAETQFDMPPDQLPDESVKDYLARCKELGVGSSTAAVLSKSDSEFHLKALQDYVASFDFSDEPIDMALRKFLMYARLPRETQQIDRVLECFAQTYHEANPTIYLSAENAYIIAFSLMILHTDFFNKNNKHKMQKSDYLRNTYAKGVSKDVLECFYDNITYTPFIHTDEEFVPLTKLPWTRRNSTFRNNKDLLDPYTLILEYRLDVARPSLGAVLSLEDPYEFCKLSDIQAFKKLREQFIYGPYLQLVSQRSRPEAFLSPDTTADPEHSDPGIVDIKVVKIGILYRREARRMIYSKSTWKEWGAILTSSQLYLFKDVSWIKGSVLSQESSSAAGVSTNSDTDISLSSLNKSSGIIRAPIDGFHPSSVLSTVDMMALTSSKEDSNGSNSNSGGGGHGHQKNSFLLIGRGNTQDWFAGSDEEDMQDWMTKINFASAFNTYHIGVQEPGIQPRKRSSSASLLDVEPTVNSERAHKEEINSEGEGATEEKEVNEVKEDDEESESHELSESPSEPETEEDRISRFVMSQQTGAAMAELHALRVQLVEQKLNEINLRCQEKDELIADHVRNGNHLKILAPIQQRSREAIIFAAGRLAAKLDWHYMDAKRLSCYRYLFGLEKEVETELCANCKVNNSCATSVRSVVPSMASENIAAGIASGTVAAAGSGSLPMEQGNSSKVVVTSPDNGSIVGGDIRVTTRAEGSTTSLRAPSSNESLKFYDPEVSSTSAPIAPTTSTTSNASSGQAVVKKNFQTSLRGNSMKVRKSDSLKKKPPAQEVHRTPSLMRKEEDFTLHGKKFSVVEVNPEYAAPTNHHRAASLSAGGHSKVQNQQNQQNPNSGLALEPTLSSTSYGTAESEIQVDDYQKEQDRSVNESRT